MVTSIDRLNASLLDNEQVCNYIQEPQGHELGSRLQIIQ